MKISNKILTILVSPRYTVLLLSFFALYLAEYLKVYDNTRNFETYYLLTFVNI
ncbi:MAG: hypothetical protein WBB67_05300 [bacterium]